MPYVGKNPTIGNFVKLDAITTSATTTFNLTNGGVAYYPQSPNHCLVSLNGILQAPTDSFTISGSTIIFSSALTTSDVIDFIIVLGDVLNIGTPSDNTVSLAKLTATGTKDSTTFLRGDNTFQTIGANTPAFHATLSANHNITASTDTIVQFNTESFDTNNNFDTSTYKFTPTTSGKYFVYASLRHDWSSNWGTVQSTTIYKNTTATLVNVLYSYSTTTSNYGTNYVAGVISMNGSTDYLSVYAYSNATGPQVWTGTGSFFGAYKLIGV